MKTHYTYELLEMVVHDSMIHPRPDRIYRLSQDGMGGVNERKVCFWDGGEKGGRMYLQSTEIADDERDEFMRSFG